MSKEKIYIIGAYPPEVGGVATYNYVLFNLLKQEGRRVEHINFSNSNFSSFIVQLFKIEKNCIFIDSYGISAEYIVIQRLMVYLLTIIMKNIQWIKVIHDGTLPKRYEKFSKVKKLFFRGLLFSQQILCVNQDIKEFLIQNKFRKNKLIVIGSLLPFYKNKSLNSIQKENILVTSGAFTSNYGIKEIILAYSLLPIYMQQKYKFIILNTSFTVDKQYEAELIDIIKDKKLNNVVIYKDIPYEATIEFLQKSKIYIRNTKIESFGLAKVEAVILQNHVICTPVGQHKFMKLFPYGDIESLLQNMIVTFEHIDDVDKGAQEYYKNISLENYNEILKVMQ